MVKRITGLVIVMILACCIITGCNQAPVGLQQALSSLSENDNTQAPSYDADFVNQDMLALIGGTNAELKQEYIGECFAYGTGMGIFKLAWFSPYILFDFYPVPGTAWRGEPIPGGTHEACYMFDDIPVRVWFVKASDEYIALEVEIGEVDRTRV